MADTLLDMAADSPVPVLSGTHSTSFLLAQLMFCSYCFHFMEFVLDKVLYSVYIFLMKH